MNTSVYTCAASLCVTLVACAVIRMIAPSGNTSRILSVVISVFVLCSMVSPISSLFKNLNFDTKEETFSVKEKDFSNQYDDAVITKTADYINRYVCSTLSAEGVENVSIKTVLGVDANNGIYINELNIYIDKAYTERFSEIKSIVKNTVGVEPTITEL